VVTRPPEGILGLLAGVPRRTEEAAFTRNVTEGVMTFTPSAWTEVATNG
jgi:hypothetical protein